MVKLGVIEEIIISPSGLDGIAKIKFEDQIGVIFCYILLIKYYEPGERPQMVDAYTDSLDGAAALKVGAEVEFDISVIFVNKYESISKDEALGYKQPIFESSHTEINAEVNEVSDDYTMLCNIDGLGEGILVDCEIGTGDIEIGERIRFNGEIKAEPHIVMKTNI
ncbi:hypothetical protein JHL18_04725 [Clostridium sp. YIM B02505]|uniref:Uncharacterized protein n=1 Tax=Clostridium yunnanense TaxID=2800325 RepID=A0ABS1EKQ6_9CLOT|nr:hypothetical protein [Clostridium yunnanense]MBK1809945.1 hypothetical protein [Clostridium yunnanense]